MITAPQTAAPPQTNGSARPPTSITASGTSRATVASRRPTGPKVVSVFAQWVVRMARSTRVAGATGPAHVVVGAVAPVAAGTAAAKHCPYQTAPAASTAPHEEQRSM